MKRFGSRIWTGCSAAWFVIGWFAKSPDAIGVAVLCALAAALWHTLFDKPENPL